MSVEEQHVHSRRFGEGQERKRAGESRRGKGHPLPRQQEPRLVTCLLRAEALAGAGEDDPFLSCSVLLASSPDLPQISCCAHAAPPRSFPFRLAGCPSTVIPPLPHHRAENCSLPQLQKSTPKSLAQCKHVQEVWLDGTRPWLFWLTLSFPDCSRLFLYLAVVV